MYRAGDLITMISIKMAKNKNLRTCLVTGKKLSPSKLQRFTIKNNQLVFDQGKKEQGRGGYLIPTEENLQRLKKLTKKINHFLKRQGSLTFPEKI